MKKIIILALLAIFAISCSDNGTEPTKNNKIVASQTKPNDLVPLDVGNKWVYRHKRYENNEIVETVESAEIYTIRAALGSTVYKSMGGGDDKWGTGDLYECYVQSAVGYYSDNSYYINTEDMFLDVSMDNDGIYSDWSDIYKGKASVTIDGVRYNDCDVFYDYDADDKIETYFKRGIGIIKKIEYYDGKEYYIEELVSCTLK